MVKIPSVQDQRFEDAAIFWPAVNRLARGYEANPDRRRDLVQEIQLALWRSFATFDGRCSLRTWVYRVAHNTAASYLQNERRSRMAQWVSLDEAAHIDDGKDNEASLHRKRLQDRLLELVVRLQPADRQIVLLYLEGIDAASIAEICGASAPWVATRIQRLKVILSQKQQESRHD